MEKSHPRSKVGQMLIIGTQRPGSTGKIAEFIAKQQATAKHTIPMHVPIEAVEWRKIRSYKDANLFPADGKNNKLWQKKH